MLRRNRAPLYPQARDNSENKLNDNLLTLKSNAQSPPATFTRIERKPTEEPKSSSLGNRFKVKALHPQAEITSPSSKGPSQKDHDSELNRQYYTGYKAQPIRNNLSRPPLPSQQQHPSTSPHEIFKQSFRSAPELAKESDLQQRKERDSISTELSKQQSLQFKSSLKEVRFGQVIEQSHQLFLKKRQKVRSPSILKNSSRNILNGSVISAQKERSCSVASGKDRREKEKHKNEHNVNHIIKQKYKTTLIKLQAEFNGKHYSRNNRFSGATYQSEKPVVTSPFKYKDDIFPPVYSSLFSSRKQKTKLGADIKWMRLGTLFEEREMVLAKPNYSSIEIYKSQDSYCQEYFPGALNGLLNCPKLLERIFEEQTINQFGIYLVKIYQESIWKYIIVDDYIPVFKGQDGKIKPAYLNVRVANHGPIDIWPFLLEKAYANYYSSYEALHYGNIVDFVEELTGVPSEKIKLKSQSHRKGDKMTAEQSQVAVQKVTKALKAGNIIALAQFNAEQGHAPLHFNIFRNQLCWSDPFCQYKQRKISFQSLKDNFTAIYLIYPFKNTNLTTTILRRNRPNTNKKLPAHHFQAEYPSIRKLQVKTPGEYQLTIKQRDKRFFHFKENYGDYIWVRGILLQKQYDQSGFRWIAGQYSNKKAINFTSFFDKGEYYLLIETQWQANSPSELMIHLYGPSECNFTREVFKPEDRLIEKGCLDLAQRYGELNQINKFICSYNYITENVGLIIENIVNERVTGNVSVMRSIRGLKCKSQILPVNSQFYQQITTEEGESLLKLNQQIELDIAEGQHYTVVLKMRGGIDSKFFKTFDFGG